MASEGLHEAAEKLSPRTIDMHRAIVSMMEELEAIDWYSQRVDASTDEQLKKILAHNMNEEKEHFAMALEWVRRQDEVFDKYLRQYLFSQGEITLIEEQLEAAQTSKAAAQSQQGSIEAAEELTGSASVGAPTSGPAQFDTRNLTVGSLRPR